MGDIVERHVTVEGIRMKECLDCKSLYPADRVVCLKCGFDETCACCHLYDSRHCEPDCLHLDMYSAYDWGGKEES